MALVVVTPLFSGTRCFCVLLFAAFVFLLLLFPVDFHGKKKRGTSFLLLASPFWPALDDLPVVTWYLCLLVEFKGEPLPNKRKKGHHWATKCWCVCGYLTPLLLAVFKVNQKDNHNFASLEPPKWASGFPFGFPLMESIRDWTGGAIFCSLARTTVVIPESDPQFLSLVREILENGTPGWGWLLGFGMGIKGGAHRNSPAIAGVPTRLTP